MIGASKGEQGEGWSYERLSAAVSLSRPCRRLYKLVPTAKLLAQKPNCNLKLSHKNSVFSVPIIVTTSILTMAYVIFLLYHYDS